MGQFSWLTSDDMKPIVTGKEKDVFLLFPKSYENIIKDCHIKESLYGGYGVFGGEDVYEVAAELNREYLSEELLEEAPTLDNFAGLYDFEKDELRKEGKSEDEIKNIELSKKEKYFQIALNLRKKMINSMLDYKYGVTSDDVMSERYGEGWKREIGIAIACYNEQNASLHYPIKIVSNPDIVYEEAKPSLSDPYQGTGERYSKEVKEYINKIVSYMDYYMEIGDSRRKEQNVAN